MYPETASLDLLGTLGLGLSAATVVSVLAFHLEQTTAARVRLIALLATWFGLEVAAAATQAFHYQHGLPVLREGLGLGLSLFLPIAAVVLSIRRSPRLRQALQNMPLAALIGVNAVRVLGVDFVLLYAANRLPAPFAPSAGWGDIFIGLTALPVAFLTTARPQQARPWVWLWNSLGLLDLIVAVSLGITSSPGRLHLLDTHPDAGIMMTLPWLLIPGFLVPLLISTHLGVFYRLATSRKAQDRGWMAKASSPTSV